MPQLRGNEPILGLNSSDAPVAFQIHASPPGVATPICAIQDSWLGSHVFAHYCYLIVCIPQ
jgi:hypothetical protein